VKKQFQEIIDECGIHIEPLNMEVTMKEIEFLCEQIAIECAAVCENNPTATAHQLRDMIINRFDIEF
jgi:hypothetical protein